MDDWCERLTNKAVVCSFFVVYGAGLSIGLPVTWGLAKTLSGERRPTIALLALTGLAVGSLTLAIAFLIFRLVRKSFVECDRDSEPVRRATGFALGLGSAWCISHLFYQQALLAGYDRAFDLSRAFEWSGVPVQIAASIGMGVGGGIAFRSTRHIDIKHQRIGEILARVPLVAFPVASLLLMIAEALPYGHAQWEIALDWPVRWGLAVKYFFFTLVVGTFMYIVPAMLVIFSWTFLYFSLGRSGSRRNRKTR